MLPITAFYAALLAVLFLVLSVRVIGWRREERTEPVRGEDAELIRRVRAQANFAEYAPLTLLLMALAEGLTTPSFLLHLAGLLLLAGRVLHAYGTSQSPPIMRYASYGTVMTLVALALLAIVCLSLSAFFLAV